MSPMEPHLTLIVCGIIQKRNGRHCPHRPLLRTHEPTEIDHMSLIKDTTAILLLATAFLAVPAVAMNWQNLGPPSHNVIVIEKLPPMMGPRDTWYYRQEYHGKDPTANCILESDGRGWCQL